VNVTTFGDGDDGPVPDLEPNDTIETATIVELLPAFDGAVDLDAYFEAELGDGEHGSLDVDMYSVEVPAGQRLNIYFGGDGGVGGVLRLFDAEGSEIQWLAFEQVEGEGFFSAEFVAPVSLGESATYFVGISGLGNDTYDPNDANSGTEGATGSYFVVFFTTNSFEPNDTFTTATPIELTDDGSGQSSAYVSGFIGDGAEGNLDVDIYAIDISEGFRLTTALAPGWAPVVRLFDQAGAEVEWELFDDGFEEFGEVLLIGPKATTATTFFVAVSGAGNDDYDPTLAGSGTAGETGSYSIFFSMESVAEAENEAPTDIALSASTIAENNVVGAVVGTFSTTDFDADDTFTYELVSGEGDTDNDSFAIVGGELRAATSFNFEARNSYTVRVRATDAGGLFTEKEFTITVQDVAAEPLVITGVTPPEAGVYGLGQKVRFTITFSDNVVVRGKPRLEVRSGTRVRSAAYVSGSGTAELTFEYVVRRNEVADVVSLGQKFLVSKKNSIASATATLPGPLPVELAGVPAAGVRLDAVPPKAVGRVQVPGSGSYTVGQALDFVVRFTEVVFVSGSPRITLTGFTGATRQATYVSGSGTDSLTFRYELEAGDALRRGKRLGLGKSIVLPSGDAIGDEAGNRAAVKISAASFKGIQIDTASGSSSLAWAGLGDAGGPSSPSARTAAFASFG